MKKLVNGIVEYRNKVRPTWRETFAKLALEQKPDALMIACSDSRVAPNVFASTDPGDLFVVRNVGNLIPSCGDEGHSKSDESEAAAIEFALHNLNVKDIIICGHSECGAIKAIAEGREKVGPSNLKSWLRHGEKSRKILKAGHPIGQIPLLAPHNALSQINVLQQIQHLKTYPFVRNRIEAGTLRIHGWWFDIASAEVFAYEDSEERFVVIDEGEAQLIISRLTTK